MWLSLVLILVIVENHSDNTLVSAGRFRTKKFKEQHFQQQFMTESRRTCGEIPLVKEHLPLKPHPTVVAFGQIPWQVGVFYVEDGSFLCSGTLISPSHVLTAAVCLISIQVENRLIVRVGDWDISGHDSPYEAYNEFSSTVKKVILLEDETETEAEMKKHSLGTVALLILKEGIDFSLYPHVLPICLPNLKNNETGSTSESDNEIKIINKTCTVTGWGIQETEPLSNLSKNKDRNTIIQFDEQNDKVDKSNDEAEPRPVRSDFENTDSLSKKSDMGISGPILISIPLFHKNVENHVDFVTDPLEMESGPRHNEQMTTPRMSDVIADDYVNFNFHIADIDPLLNSDLEYVPFSQSDDMVNTLSTTEKNVLLNKENILTKNFKTPGDNFVDFPFFHEAMFRHKQKYKSGKVRSKNVQQLKSEEQQTEDKIDNEQRMNLEKRGQIGRDVPKEGNVDLRERQFPNYFQNILDERQEVLNPQPILKQSLVSFRPNCEAIPAIERGEGNLGSSCVFPLDSSESPSLCMVDLGSPVACIEKLDKKLRQGRSISSNSKSQRLLDDNDSQPFDFSTKPLKKNVLIQRRYVLRGIVTWKRPCYVKDEMPLQKYTIVTETQEFLLRLFQVLQKQS